MPHIFHVLLTGGVGSRQSRPKQYLDLFSGSSPDVSKVTSSVFSNGRAEEKMYREVEKSDASLFELAGQRNAGFSNGLIVVGNQGNRHLSYEENHFNLNLLDV